MWILSIDTATKITGLAVHKGRDLIAETYLHTAKTHSERLMPLILQILENAGISFDGLQAVAVASGPGSFTGLRIGMATAKGIAQVRKLPIVGINTLDALAQCGLGFPGLIVPILDARKDEVYSAFYHQQGSRIKRVSEYRAISPSNLVQELSEAQEKVLFVGDAVKAYSSMLDFPWATIFPDQLGLPRGAHVGALAALRLENADTDDLYDLRPYYIRPSEAEVTWAKKFGREGQ